MTQRRIFLTKDRIKDRVVISDTGIIRKLKTVMRIKDGDNVYIFDGEGSQYQYLIKSVSKKELVIKKIKLDIKEEKNKNNLILAFPLTKEERIDFIFQKATELGVNRFIPFVSERSLIRTNKVSDNKCQRWNKIIIEAVRQSSQLWLPSVEKLISFKELLKINAATKIYGEIYGKKIDSFDFSKTKEVLLAVGPEGDFSSQEKQDLKQAGFLPAKISKHILRVETAAIFLAGLIRYNMD